MGRSRSRYCAAGDPSYYGERYARGHVVEDGRHLYISSGFGTSGLPVRFLAPPEVVVLELRPADPRADTRRRIASELAYVESMPY